MEDINIFKVLGNLRGFDYLMFKFSKIGERMWIFDVVEVILRKFLI